MKKLMLSALFATGLVAAIEAAPTDAVTQADLKALIERINKLEAENKAQAKKIAELEGVKAAPAAAAVAAKPEEGTEVSESGKIYTTKQGFKYYLADAGARIFDPLSESGLKITPYGYLVLEGTYMDHAGDLDWTTDVVENPNGNKYENQTSTLSVNDSIFGLQFDTPEKINGWSFTGRAEFDLLGGGSANANDYGFHWRHLFVNAQHESGWSILAGQTWHLWKIVTPSEIDGAWLENAGHPYRRSPQIRVTKKWDWDDSSFEWRLGIVKNGPGMNGDRDGDGVDNNSASMWPLFETALVYDHVAPWEAADSGKRWLIGVGGQYGRDRSRGLVASTNDDGDKTYSFDGDWDDYDSSMLLFAAKVPYRDFTLTGQFFAGRNLGRVQAGVNQTVMYNVYTGKGEDIVTMGGFVDLAYQINDTWSAAIGYGFDHPDVGGDTVVSDNDGGFRADKISHNDRAYIDVFYQVCSNFKLGLEYARLNTRYSDVPGGNEGGDAYANRVQFTAFYDF